MNTLTYTCHTLTLDYSRNKEIEEVNLDLSKLIGFNYMNIFESIEKLYIYAKKREREQWNLRS